jgi:chromosome segregation ATPase
MDGSQVIGYSVAVTAAVNGVVWVAKKLTQRGSDQDEWTRRLVDEQMTKRESERADCTERINVLTTRLDVVEERASAAEAKVDECEGKHRRILEDRVNDITVRHQMVRQLRDITAKYDELRGIVDVISELPPSSPPPRINILGDEP